MSTLFLLLACTGAEPGDSGGSGDPVPTGPGTLALSFRLYADLLVSVDEPPAGTFHGSIFAEDDATSVGIVDGATSIVDFEVPGLDLSVEGGPSAVAWTSGPIEPQIVWVLGCLDSDANDCEEGDPITVPNDNKLQIAAGVETSFEIFLGMLHPS